jgi:hypothetical protein
MFATKPALDYSSLTLFPLSLSCSFVISLSSSLGKQLWKSKVSQERKSVHPAQDGIGERRGERQEASNQNKVLRMVEDQRGEDRFVTYVSFSRLFHRHQICIIDRTMGIIHSCH